MGGYLWRKILCEHLTRLGLRLYTMYIDSSSFEAEQDISKLNKKYLLPYENVIIYEGSIFFHNE